MSEHQELIAAICHLAQEQKRTTDAVIALTEALAGIKPTIPEPVQQPEQIETPAPEVNNPTNPAHAVKHDDPTPSEDDLKKALMEYSKKTSREQAKALLEKHGAKKVSDVADDDRAAIIAEMEG